MASDTTLSPARLRDLVAENPKSRPRDLAQSVGASEAALLAAQGATRITASPDAIMPALAAVGEVMALTRNDHVVHEKIGVYDNYHSGEHAAMVLTQDIDLRIFGRHWVYAFAAINSTGKSVRRSLQIFDAAGDAVHKVYAREGTDIAAWESMVAALATGETDETLPVAPRPPVEVAKADPAKLDILRKEWAAMTDTHQFMRLTSKLRMNRLGAYRIVGAPFVKPLAPQSLNDALIALSNSDVEVMVFVGNRGCIQIHSGPINTLREMGPWQNVMDPGFTLHLRADHVAEVWMVEKPTKRGPAVSLEAFAADGELILQMFARRKENENVDYTEAYRAILDALPTLHPEEV